MKGFLDANLPGAHTEVKEPVACPFFYTGFTNEYGYLKGHQYDIGADNVLRTEVPYSLFLLLENAHNTKELVTQILIHNSNF